MRNTVLPAGLILALTSPLTAQWTHRYPKVQGYSHHVYLEGYELPTLTAGPIDPAPSPDGRTVALSSRGWLWLLDLHTRVARRITSGGAMDFRPAWHPDGQQVALVRDDGADTWIVVLDLASGSETIVNTPAIELDPAFSADGLFLYYASASAGDIDLWRRELATGRETRLTSEQGIELAPRAHPDGRHVVFLAKSAANDLRVLDLTSGAQTVLATERIVSLARPALSPQGDLVAYTWPTQERYELRLLSLADPTTSLLLTASDGLPLAPAWSADGRHVYFAEADDAEVMALKRVARDGGRVEVIPVLRWDWGEPTGTLRITTTLAGSSAPAASRLSVVDGGGHPAVPMGAQSRFDGQNGRVFFYSPGVIDVTVPAGSVRVAAVQGLATPEVSEMVRVGPGEIREVALALGPVWDARAAGWISGDHHFHLNYGGQYRLTPEDLFPMLRGEALDVATPLLANLHNRFEDQRLWRWEHLGGLPLIQFGQEVRSHFLGHLGLIGVAELFWPWIWGPGYQVYGRDDRPNTAVLEHAHRQGGLAAYVHPFSGRDPFAAEGLRTVPVELVADGVLGGVDLLEVACLWSDELGTSALWHRLLNLGVPVAPSAGTDVMNNFYRTMAVGTTRVYAFTGGATSWPAYLAALRGGRSFVTTGPLLDFRVGDARPGDTVPANGRVRWSLELRTAIPVARVEVFVNGAVAWSARGPDAPGGRSFSGTLDLPAGGWVAARAHGGQTRWPAMDSYPFAHTAPVWIGTVGSTEPATRRQAAAELLQVLEASEARLHQAYEGVMIPNLQAVFGEARARLEEVLAMR
jgi:TolB protein